MKKEEMFSLCEKEVKETRTQIAHIMPELREEEAHLSAILAGHFGQWINLINEMDADLASKGMDSAIPHFIIAFANLHHEFLSKKKEYLSRCIALIDRYESFLDSSDSEELTQIGAALSSIANSLGLSIPMEEEDSAF